ncbi:hypothetical protein CEXT_641951 [Caerostris extrusa]|uniref:Uncharacterized protein n=1 Tax=Caerostris extrusa TaxID=172846 RepID=A0AAV4Q7P8_CAEEX|nr:hypothetical protein CEXT_641951 [Caerostris extrusa]
MTLPSTQCCFFTFFQPRSLGKSEKKPSVRSTTFSSRSHQPGTFILKLPSRKDRMDHCEKAPLISSVFLKYARPCELGLSKNIQQVNVPKKP